MTNPCRRIRRYRNELLNGAAWLLIAGGSLLIFYSLMAVNNWPLKNLSRTSGTTLLTWCAMGAAMTNVYGGVRLGRKRRQLISGQLIGCLATDCVTYLQLQIMNVNPNNNPRLMLLGEDLPWLLLAMLFQAVLIVLTVCAGNGLYFRLNPPQQTLLILGEGSDEAALMGKLQTQSRLRRVTHICRYDAPELEERLAQSKVAVLAAEIPAQRRAALMQRCYEWRITALCCAAVPDILMASAAPVIIDDAPFLETPSVCMSLWQRLIKRAMDIVLSGAMLMLLWPVMLAAAAAIRLADGGPVLFRQQRLTSRGKPFDILKFRTMQGDSRAVSAAAADPRITRTGAFLRRWRIDELPQLFNILRGDMSLVGPRPEMVENVTRYKETLPAFAYRERMKAGLTGYAQIEGRYNTSAEDKLLMDLMYMQQFSIWNDVKLLLRTLTVFFRPDSTDGFPE